ncbi:hypothetical protein [Aureivirga marina]|uniref:hypothetical protein n=1 Tax=Aureivirga marina TaxID=1182451 RepID=UPI0018C92699|nr:hypothetical protein [Aureivirga marina]
MNTIFDFIYKLLKAISGITGLTYVEINIIVYYFIIPGYFLYLIQKIFKKKYWIPIYISLTLITILFIPNFYLFSKDLFQKSVVFLNWFEIIGLNYTEASVVICVFVPIIIVSYLYYFKAKKNKIIKE